MRLTVTVDNLFQVTFVPLKYPTLKRFSLIIADIAIKEPKVHASVTEWLFTPSPSLSLSNWLYRLVTALLLKLAIYLFEDEFQEAHFPFQNVCLWHL